MVTGLFDWDFDMDLTSEKIIEYVSNEQKPFLTGLMFFFENESMSLLYLSNFINKPRF